MAAVHAVHLLRAMWCLMATSFLRGQDGVFQLGHRGGQGLGARRQVAAHSPGAWVRSRARGRKMEAHVDAHDRILLVVSFRSLRLRELETRFGNATQAG
jgi:hypothetical protein